MKYQKRLTGYSIWLLLLLAAAWLNSNVYAQNNLPAGTYRLRNQCGTKLLDVYGASTAQGANLIQWSDNGGQNQKFNLQPTGGGYFTLTAAHSGMAVDVQNWQTADGTTIQQWTPNNADAQQWRAIDVGGGFYKVETRLAANRVLDVAGASTSDGTKVHLWTANGTCAQAWKFEPVGGTPTINNVNAYLARTVNFGNALEAQNEGDWGMVLEERFFQLSKDAGFTAIRLPTKFNAHAAANAPYALDETFMQRVDWAINQALSRNLAIIVDFHHYDELMTEPAANRDRFLGIWQQIATRYRNQPDKVLFEIHNEPNGNIEPVWNEYLAAALAVIRQTNPTRAVVVGPNGWNNPDRLEELVLPNDQNLIVTVHDYTPFNFTHQGAGWINPVPPLGVFWNPTDAKIAPPWMNYSWQTNVRVIGNSFEITYQAGWAGFYLHRDNGVNNFSGLRLRTDRAVSLIVKCFADSNDPGGITIQTQPGQTRDVPLSQCGNPSTLRVLMIQNNSPDPQTAFNINQLELYDANSTTSLIATSEDEARAPLETVRAWAQRNNRPMFVGEFGSFSTGDIDSRVRWTTFVRSEAERMNLSWGYWEFGAGFGIYDRSTNQWRRPLLQALIPNSGVLNTSR
jgi:endoglucanase